MALHLGHTLVIANPASQSGAGAEGAEFVRRTLAAYGSATDGFVVRLTTGPGVATQMARAATDFDTVLALGGDGVIHEVVNGLMKIGEARRPRLGIIPLGSGNDFARTLGMAANSPERSLGQLLQGVAHRLDLGIVNGTYFDQTLSFGVDAAIALDTMERRQRRGAHGTRLFMASGVDVVRHQLRSWPHRVRFDGGAEQDGDSLIFAVQVGPTYGGLQDLPRGGPGGWPSRRVLLARLALDGRRARDSRARTGRASHGLALPWLSAGLEHRHRFRRRASLPGRRRARARLALRDWRGAPCPRGDTPHLAVLTHIGH